MKFHFFFILILVLVISSCLSLQSTQAPTQSSAAAGEADIVTQAYPDGLLHFTASILTSSGGISAAFSITPAGEVIQSLEPDILPPALQRGSGFLQPVWSTADRKILFAHYSKENHHWIIYTMDGDGRNIKNIYTAAPQKHIISPVWSASSGEIYFYLASESDAEFTDVTLCRISAQGQGYTEITALSFPGTPVMLRLSPDEKKAACIYVESSFVESKAEPAFEHVVHVIDLLNGSEQRRVPGFDLAWLPDSKAIAVIRPTVPAIQIIDVAMGTMKSIQTASQLPLMIAANPDGNTIASISESGSKEDEKYRLQLISLDKDIVHDVPVKIQQCFSSGLFWTR